MVKSYVLALTALLVMQLNAQSPTVSPEMLPGLQNKSETGFYENKGQVCNLGTNTPNEEVKFVLERGGTNIFVMENGIAYQFNRMHYPEGYQELAADRSPEKQNQLMLLQKEIRIETWRMDMTLVGANSHAVILTEGKSPDYNNYYNHNALDVHHYSKVTYKEIYPGIDWVIYVHEEGMKYDFIVHPGADPSQIRMKFTDQESLSLNEDGSFTLGTPLGNISENAPLSFQGEKTIGTYFRLNGNEITFDIGEYSSAEEFVIDPLTRVWGTYYGGTINDYAKSTTIDFAGNVFMCGTTTSSNFIAASGHQNSISGMQDAFVAKFDPNCLRLWGSYYGGSGDESGYSCATDNLGNIYLAGITNSISGISASGYQNTYGGGSDDAFIVKFNSSGTRLWASYYGGSDTDEGRGCVTDVAGNVFLCGSTRSLSGIASLGFQNVLGGMSDGFLAKFSSTGIHLWGTYYGGSDADYLLSCSSDLNGNIVVCGTAVSLSGIAASGHQSSHGGGYFDAMIIKFNSSGTRLWASYYGGTDSDVATSCFMSAHGKIYLVGNTYSLTAIAIGGHQIGYGGSGDAYLVKFDSTGVREWGSYYGGAALDYGYSCVTDTSENVYLAGTTYSASGIGYNGFQNSFSGGADGFVAKFNSSGTRIFGSYYGQSQSDEFLSCRVDADANLYVAGSSNSSGMAVAGHQNSPGGGGDALLVKFYYCIDIIATVIHSNTTCFNGNNGSATVSASGGSSLIYNWTPSGGNSSSATGLAAGTYTCTITNDCGSTATVSVTITQPAVISGWIGHGDVSCFGGSNANAGISVGGGTGPYSYNWAPGNPTGDGTASVFGLTAGTWSCTVTDANNCTETITTIITQPSVLTAASSATSITCNGGTATVTVVGSGGTSPYTGTGTFSVTAGTYSYTVTDANGCTTTTSITVTEPTALTSSSSATSILCNGGNATVTVTGSGGTSPYTGEGTFTVTAGTYSYTVTDANGCTSTTTITVTEPAAISTSVVSVNVTCNGDSTGSIDVTVAGGTAPFTFDWNSGTYTTEDLTNIPGGTYSCVLTDANGCTDGGTIVISEPTVLVASLTAATDPTTCAGTDGSIDITVSGGTIGYSYLWSNAATTEDLSGIGAGAYSCTVTDTNGCIANVSANLNDPMGPTVTLSLALDTICIDDTPYTLSGEAPAGGTFSGPSVTAGSFDPITAGIGTHLISYTYTDINGCSGSTTDSIYVDVCAGMAPFYSFETPFSIYPNPNNGAFTLQLNSTSAADVTIYDAQGKLVMTQKVQPNIQPQMHIESCGIYLITVITSDGARANQRVVVTK